MKIEHTSSPVCQTVFDTVSWKFCRAGRGKDEITLQAGVDDLNDDILVAEADDETVFGSIAE